MQDSDKLPTSSTHAVAGTSRLTALAATGLLDSDAEPSFDRLTRLAAKFLGTPVALVSLVDADRQFFKSCIGLPEPWASRRETPLTHSFCRHVVTSRQPLIINDARLDLLVMDNGAVADLGVIAYLGIPLEIDGQVIGSFCAIDGKPRSWTSDDIEMLGPFAESVVTEIQSRFERDELKADDRRKNEFLAMLAHELRNPLAAISNGVQLMDKIDKPDILAEIRSMIRHQVDHLTRLIDDLLDVSRITQGKIVLKKETVSLADAVGLAVHLARPLIDQKQHRLQVSLPAGPVRFVADPTRTEQILGNLLTNAAKYTEPGGAIDLSAAVENHEIVFRIRDTGVGISAEMLPQVFSLFTQVDASHNRSQGGLGIGLTLVRNLVEMHGGRVTAVSQGKGHGSEFTVRLPIGEPAADISEAKDQDSATPAAGVGRILVVDDNYDTAKTTAILLSHRGYQVHTAHSGPDALNAARHIRPHLILLDIGLPGMSGYEVAAKLRDDDCCKDAVLIAVSGYADDKTRQRSKSSGFQRHLIKPINFHDLFQLIDSFPSLVSVYA